MEAIHPFMNSGVAPPSDQHVLPGVTTNSATATNCVPLYDLRGIH